jgi:predicted nucleic acid-binding protein
VTVLVDTSIWSLMLRHNRRHLSRQQEAQVAVLEELVAAGQARLAGAVRQEILTGIKHREQFARLQRQLRDFPDVELDTGDYETAAEISNQCQARGIVGSSIDMLLCSVALRRAWAIYTSDRDFERYASHLDLSLYS